MIFITHVLRDAESPNKMNAHMGCVYLWVYVYKSLIE